MFIVKKVNLDRGEEFVSDEEHRNDEEGDPDDSVDDGEQLSGQSSRGSSGMSEGRQESPGVSERTSKVPFISGRFGDLQVLLVVSQRIYQMSLKLLSSRSCHII